MFFKSCLCLYHTVTELSFQTKLMAEIILKIYLKSLFENHNIQILIKNAGTILRDREKFCKNVLPFHLTIQFFS